MKKIRVVFYWLSIIPPLIDIVKGAILGISKGVEDAKTGARRVEAQQAEWEKANRG